MKLCTEAHLHLQDGLSNWDFHPRDFGSVLHCVEIGGAYHFALNSKQDAFLYTPPKDAIERHASCCRAEKKLEEVFTALGMLKQRFGLAIDIGESAFRPSHCLHVLHPHLILVSIQEIANTTAGTQ